MMALYVHRNSLLHRLSPGVKLAGLALAGAAVFVLPGFVWQAAVLAVVILLYRLARLPLAETARALKPVIVLIAAIGLFQLFAAGPLAAAVIAARIITLVLLAALVTLTTPFTAMIDTFARAAALLRPLGVNPHKVGLAAALAVRFIPVLLSDYREIQDARRGRGARSPGLFAAGPLLIKTLRMAGTLADAVEARGFENRR
ncbi:MAG: energy-coupling factor transporter transmembrane component T family protein [Dichotomicrobium sp.]